MLTRFGTKFAMGQGRAALITGFNEMSLPSTAHKAQRITASNISHPLPLLSFSTGPMDTPCDANNDMVKEEQDDHMTMVQGLQGKPVHDFNPAWARDMVAEAVAEMDKSPQDKFDSVLQGVQNGMVKNDSSSSQTSNCSPHDVVSESYQHSSHVSLYSVMQSNVPHPYSRSPTHLNMPCGGQAQQDKYISAMRQDTHPSRNFSTSARNSDQFSMSVQHQVRNQEVPAAQGVQGFECDRFKLWVENCHRYRFGNCDEQIQSVQTGRKTLSEIFQEQDQFIEQVATDYKARIQAKNMPSAHVLEYDESDMQGLQGTPARRPQILADERETSVQGSQNFQVHSTDVDMLSSANPCPQGIQGSDCENFKLWLENCMTYGFTDCGNQLHSLQAGRKTLQQIFDEQDTLIREISEQYSKSKASSIRDERA